MYNPLNNSEDKNGEDELTHWLFEWVTIQNSYGERRLQRYTLIAYLTACNAGCFSDRSIPKVEYDFNPFFGCLDEKQKNELENITKTLNKFQNKGYDIYLKVHKILKHYVREFSNNRSLWT